MTPLVSVSRSRFSTRGKEGATVSTTLLSLCVIEITVDSKSAVRVVCASYLYGG